MDKTKQYLWLAGFGGVGLFLLIIGMVGLALFSKGPAAADLSPTAMLLMAIGCLLTLPMQAVFVWENFVRPTMRGLIRGH